MSEGTLPGWLPAPLREPTSWWKSAGLGWALAFGGSLILSALVSRLFPSLGTPRFPVSGAYAFFLLVIFSPLVETLIMGGALLLLLRFLPPGAAIVVSAVGWGIAHSTAAPAWGLIIWWPFLILSTLFVAWRERGIGAAMGIAALTHALQNLVPGTFVALGLPG
ncbi:CPBP family glutamic-type intramembrane protease [Sphingomonas sp. ASV193]|uniref:type II CAAX prenyl endopeptidase Rce1 family protein n=1 Tax=Sphingomonas sp. ASV193 TaxID=3144405 RepID=UPI0032E87155